MRSKKAQFGLGFAIIAAIMIFIVGMITVNFIKDEVTRTRGEVVCSNPSSDGTKLLCLTIDVVVPYFIVTVLSLAGGLIIAKFSL